MKKFTSDKWMIVAVIFFVLASGYMPPAGAQQPKSFGFDPLSVDAQGGYFHPPGTTIGGIAHLGGIAGGYQKNSVVQGQRGLTRLVGNGGLTGKVACIQIFRVGGATPLAPGDRGGNFTLWPANNGQIFTGVYFPNGSSPGPGWKEFCLNQADTLTLIPALFKGMVGGSVGHLVFGVYPENSGELDFVSPYNETRALQRPRMVIRSAITAQGKTFMEVPTKDEGTHYMEVKGKKTYYKEVREVGIAPPPQ